MKKVLFFFAAVILSFAATAQTKDTTATRPHCTATTQSGTTCKRYAAAASVFCNTHNPNAHRCGQPTKSGAPCKRAVKVSGVPCSTHKPKSVTP